MAQIIFKDTSFVILDRTLVIGIKKHSNLSDRVVANWKDSDVNLSVVKNP